MISSQETSSLIKERCYKKYRSVLQLRVELRNARLPGSHPHPPLSDWCELFVLISKLYRYRIFYVTLCQGHVFTCPLYNIYVGVLASIGSSSYQMDPSNSRLHTDRLYKYSRLFTNKKINSNYCIENIAIVVWLISKFPRQSLLHNRAGNIC